MVKKLILGFILFSSLSYSQEKIEYIDIDFISKIANQHSNNGDFDKALEAYTKISKNDSSYCAVLTSKSYYYIQLKKFDEAIEISNEGLNIDCDDNKLFYYINKGVSYSYQKKYADALSTYEEALKIYPKNETLWYNKGTVLENLDRINDAVSAYQNSILINPTYKKPHLQLGNICYKQEKFSQALMCFDMYLLLGPDDDDAFDILKSLNNLVSSKNSNEANPDIIISKDDESFEDIDLVLSNKIALKDNYVVDNKIKISLVKQNHALLAQLKDFDGNEGFWSKKYVPLYNWISDNNYFDAFIYTIAFSIENEKYKKIVDKNTNEIIEFLDLFNAKWESLVEKNNVLIDGNEQEVTYYFENYLQGIGVFENNKTIGHWELYTEDGKIQSFGNFNSGGKRQGEWIWYNKHGKISEKSNYKNGIVNGDYISFHENGKPFVVSKYLNGELDGEYIYYNDKGALIQKKQFDNGILDGVYKSYFPVGEKLIEYYIPYEKDLIKNKYFEYYATGDVYSEVPFKNGKQNGIEKKYRSNGSISTEANYTDGKLNGAYKSYFKNGNVYEVGQYLEGQPSGSWNTYYDDGILESEYSYNNGELTGSFKYYDFDGKLYYEYLYRKGEIIAYSFFDKQGEIIKSDKKKGGEFYYVGYSTSGNVTSAGYYDIKGGKKGNWKFYSNNGILNEEGGYQDNNAEGKQVSYFSSGVTKSISNYKANQLSGYYSDFYKNGQLKNQGWYKENLHHGEWRSYYIDGTLKSTLFLHKGKLHGDQFYYGPEGRIYNINKYKYDELVSETYFDVNGEEFEKIDYQPKMHEYKLTYHSFNDNVRLVLSYVNGIKHGDFLQYNFYGDLITKGSYLNGKEHDEWIYYDDDKNIKNKINYINGNEDGESINYFPNGVVKSITPYEFGVAEKSYTSYNDKGILLRVSEYKNGETHGRREFYSATGKLQLIRFYEHGTLIGYSYYDKNGEELPMIKLTNETGKITTYFDNGTVARDFEYLNGALINSYKSYYYNGTLESENMFTDDDYNGLNTEYYEGGTVKLEENYIFDHLDGTVKEYYENGVLKKETNYANNIKSGDSNTYNENGKLVKKESYFNGEIYASEKF